MEDIYTLTPMQTGILYHSLHDDSGTAYLQQGSCRLRGELDRDRLIAAWKRVAKRHAALRTSFHWKGVRQPVQVVSREAGLPVPFHDWCGVAPDNHAAAVREWLTADLNRPFDLQTAPLLRVAIIRYGDEDHRIVWTYHHLILDAWAEANLLREVMAYYAGGNSVLPEPPAFREYVRWLKSAGQPESIAYWSEYLAGIAWEQRPVSRGGDYNTALVRMEPGAALTLREYAVACGVTVHSVVLSVWALFLSLWLRRQDVVFGVTVSGRPNELPHFADAVGVFFNTIPFRIVVEAGESIESFVRRVHASRVSSAAHELTPLSIVREAARAGREVQLFDTVSVFLNKSFLTTPERLGDCVIEDLRYSSRSSYPLTFRVMELTPMTLELLHSIAAIRPSAAMSLLQTIARILEAVAQRRTTAVDEIVAILCRTDGGIGVPPPSRVPNLAATRPKTAKA